MISPAVIAIKKREGKITQSDLARAIGTSQPTISNILAGKQSPTVSQFERILDSLGLAMLDLLEAADDRDLAELTKLVKKVQDSGNRELVRLINRHIASLIRLLNSESRKT